MYVRVCIILLGIVNTAIKRRILNNVFYKSLYFSRITMEHKMCKDITYTTSL